MGREPPLRNSNFGERQSYFEISALPLTVLDGSGEGTVVLDRLSRVILQGHLTHWVCVGGDTLGLSPPCFLSCGPTSRYQEGVAPRSKGEWPSVFINTELNWEEKKKKKTQTQSGSSLKLFGYHAVISLSLCFVTY